MFVAAGVLRFSSHRFPFPLVINTRLESDNNPNIEPPNIWRVCSMSSLCGHRVPWGIVVFTAVMRDKPLPCSLESLKNWGIFPLESECQRREYRKQKKTNKENYSGNLSLDFRSSLQKNTHSRYITGPIFSRSLWRLVSWSPGLLVSWFRGSLVLSDVCVCGMRWMLVRSGGVLTWPPWPSAVDPPYRRHPPPSLSCRLWTGEQNRGQRHPRPHALHLHLHLHHNHAFCSWMVIGQVSPDSTAVPPFRTGNGARP